MSQMAVADSETGLAYQDLAKKHGLASAGRQPGMLEYARSLWSYRHFIASFANARVTAALGSTRLGMFWQVLTPLINAGVYFTIFGVILDTKRSIHHFIAYLCIGVFVFGFTQAVVQSGVQAISGNLGLIRALNFPRAAMPIALTLVEIRNMIFSTFVLMVIVVASGVHIDLQWLLVVPALALQSIYNVGLALFVARVGTKFHDLRQLIPFIMRFWLYGSAVIYPITYFTEKLHGWKLYLLELNPLLVYIDLMRHALMQNVPLAGSAWRLWTEALGWAVVSFVVGYRYFWRGEKGYGRG